MSNLPGKPPRADAVRSRRAILDAAVRVLNERPNASIADVARAAGLSRQTVYAHYPTRESLVLAVTERATQEAVAAMEAAMLDRGPAREALLRLIDIGWRLAERYPILLRTSDVPMTAEQVRQMHASVIGPFEDLIRRGQRAGDFDPDVSPQWLSTVAMALDHAAGAEVAAGRMTVEQAVTQVRRALLRLFLTDDARLSK